MTPRPEAQHQRLADVHAEADEGEREQRVDHVTDPRVLPRAEDCATPMKLTAPGTSSRNAGVIVASAGGADRRRSTQAATGVMTSAPTKAPSCVESSVAPSRSPVHAARSTT